MKKRFLGFMLTLFVISTLFSAVQITVSATASEVWDGTIADGFESGTGTKEDPYIIKTAEQLAYLASSINDGTNYYDIYIKLANNIKLNDTTNWEAWGISAPENIWTPIGTDSSQFNGHFDGAGYEVSGICTMEPSDGKEPFAPKDNQGLFGFIDGWGVIENLGITESYICGSYGVGGIAGESSGKIINCYNSGIIVGWSDAVGGIVGKCWDSTVADCYNTGTIICEEWSTNVGGVVGDGTASVVKNCYNTGSVTGGDVGGVVGSSGGTTINCYNSGRVIGKRCYVGGVVGSSGGTTINCYNTGDVSGAFSVGGITGNNNGTINNSYNIGNVSGEYYVGSIAGEVYSSAIRNCYYLERTAKDFSNTVQFGIGNSTSGLTTSDVSGMTTMLTREELVLKASFEGFDFKNVWTIEPSAGYNYPRLISMLDKSYGESSAIWDGTVASGFESGTGTEADPYIIKTAEQLAYLASSTNSGTSYLGEFIKLENDIQLNDTSKKYWTLNAAQWVPIGTGDNFFRGSFNGNGHKISGLYINNVDFYQGLFGYVAAGYQERVSIIKNIGVTDSYICSGYYVGSVAGSSGAAIIKCYNTGTVSGIENVGGVVGSSYNASVINCYNTGAVSGGSAFHTSYTSNIGGVAGVGTTMMNCYNTGDVSGDDNVGGVAGLNDLKMINCYNTGEINGVYTVGGVTGSNKLYATITNCYNTGDVSGAKYDVGGVIGITSAGEITDCYNSGKIVATCRMGGVVGWNEDAPINNCYNAGTVKYMNYINVSGIEDGGNYIGGVVGRNIDGTITNCYYLAGSATDGTDTEQYGIGNSNEGSSTEDVSGVTAGLSNNEMQLSDSFVGFDFDGVWAIRPSTGYSYPQFTAMLQEDPVIWNGGVADGFESGTGTEADPYIIKTPKQLAFLAYSTNYLDESYSGKYIKLANDIQLNDTTEWQNWETDAPANLWSPIGQKTNVYVYRDTFKGNFDGAGYKISGVYINEPSEYSNTQYIGLFGYIDGGTVKNLGVTDSYICGSYDVGGIVGYGGTVANCYNTSTIIGKQTVGGIAGNNSTTIENCYNTGTVISQYGTAGGIVGDGKTITNCYNTGNVSGRSNIGGIAGESSEAVTSCYNAGTIIGGTTDEEDGYAGGIVGSGYTVANCYNTGAVSGNMGIGGISGINSDINKNCYNIGTISGNENVGGIAGESYNYDDIENCYYLTGSAPEDTSGNTVGLSDADLKQATSFGGFDFDTVWTMNGKASYLYPELTATTVDIKPLETDVKADEISVSISATGITVGKTVFVTAYDSKGMCENKEVKLADNSAEVILSPTNVTEIKAFVWDENLQPLCKPVSCEIN